EFDDGDKAAERPAVRQVDFTLGKTNRHASAGAAAREVGNRVRDGWRVVLTAPSGAGLNQMLRALEGEGAPAAKLLQFPAGAMEGEGVAAVVAPFAEGWSAPADRLLVIT